jgi:hypothetical protein
MPDRRLFLRPGLAPGGPLAPRKAPPPEGSRKRGSAAAGGTKAGAAAPTPLLEAALADRRAVGAFAAAASAPGLARLLAQPATRQG